MELLILAHTPTRILDLGLLPAAAELQLNLTILTDCVREHLVRAGDSPLYAGCELAECDVFNPLAVARYAAVHGKQFTGVLAADAVLHAPAAMAAACLGLPGAAWHSAVRHDLHLFEAGSGQPRGQILDCTQVVDPGAVSFPVTVQPLEDSAASGGAIVRDAAELQRRLHALRHGYALVEAYRDDEEVYALDLLAGPAGMAILGGSRIAFDADAVRTKRIAAFMARPPRCDELLAQVAGQLGHGRHHIEYALGAANLHIRAIHNGLHDEESEFALDDQLDGNLFTEVLKASVGLPFRAPRLLHSAAHNAALDLVA